MNFQVSKYAARSKEEWEEQNKIWPTSYHPSTKFVLYFLFFFLDLAKGHILEIFIYYIKFSSIQFEFFFPSVRCQLNFF